MILVHDEGDVTKLKGSHVMKRVPFLDMVQDHDNPQVINLTLSPNAPVFMSFT